MSSFAGAGAGAGAGAAVAEAVGLGTVLAALRDGVVLPLGVDQGRQQVAVVALRVGVQGGLTLRRLPSARSVQYT
ncbi:hypothetical protein ACF05F_32185 [Rhodococcus erythropolis]